LAVVQGDDERAGMIVVAYACQQPSSGDGVQALCGLVEEHYTRASE
jgi:hypothetical protein